MFVKRLKQVLHFCVCHVPTCIKQREQQIGLTQLRSAGIGADEHLNDIILGIETGIVDAVQFLVGHNLVHLERAVNQVKVVFQLVHFRTGESTSGGRG